MKNKLLLPILCLSGIASAQQEELQNQLVEESQKSLTQYHNYVEKKKLLYLKKANWEQGIERYFRIQGEKLSFMFQGKPYFLESNDDMQILNSNVDVLHDGGVIQGLEGSYKGANIHVSVFDGGRVYEKHLDFGGDMSTRIMNKEKNAVLYSAHATGVTGIIGGIGHNLSSQGVALGNTRGMMPESTFDSYSFRRTILEGETEPKTVLEKLLASKASLSNHSYGVLIGWTYQQALPDNSGAGWYWQGAYDPVSRVSRDLNGTYFTVDKQLDDIVYNNPSMVVVKSAGNSYGNGPAGSQITSSYYQNEQNDYIGFTDTDVLPDNNCAQGYDCIGAGSVAKNIILVGSADKIKNNNGRYVSASDVVKSTFSSAGPRDDGAIKPDITGVGHLILHASTNSTGSNGWNRGSGTSYSSPQVTGIIGLWNEINKKLFNGEKLDAAGAKNLLIHSAQEAGNHLGPDVWFGWGFADAKAGAEILIGKSNQTAVFESKILRNGMKNIQEVYSDGTKPLKVSISWIDPSFKTMPRNYDEAHNNRVSRLVNDLDLRVVELSTNRIYYPWRLNVNSPLQAASKGDNRVDNVEQVLVEMPVAGRYRVEISNKGVLVDNEGHVAHQRYSVIITGHSQEDLSTNENPVREVYLKSTVIDWGLEIENSDLLKGFEIYDISGKLVKSEAKKSIAVVDLSGLSSGIYLIRMATENGKIIQKFIKK